MKNAGFIEISLASLLCLLIVLPGGEIHGACANHPPAAQRNISAKSHRLFQDPIEYVLGKLQDYDLVMIGERHRVREEPVFLQRLIKSCCEKNAIGVVFLEFGNFKDQAKIEACLKAAEYNPKPVIQALRNCTEFGWGYQEYLDIFKTICNGNKKRAQDEKVKIVLVDGPPSGIRAESQLYRCFDNSSFSEREKWRKVSWLRECIKDRDQFMAEVIATYLFDENGQKGIYYAGGHHVRKDLRNKVSGRRLFSTGGILCRKYPGRVCCLAFHKGAEWWQNESDFSYLEELLKRHGKAFALDTCDTGVAHRKLKSDIFKEGVAIEDVFDGYIVLNQDKDYQSCTLIPGFYDDEFAQIVWDRLREAGKLERLPPELSKWREKTPTGEELTWMIEEYGLR